MKMNKMTRHQTEEAKEAAGIEFGTLLSYLAPTALAELHTALKKIAATNPEGEFTLNRMADAVQWAGEINCGDDFWEMVNTQEG